MKINLSPSLSGNFQNPFINTLIAVTPCFSCQYISMNPTIMFCSSKPRKRRQRGGRNNTRRLKVRFLPLDSPSLANGTENGIALLNDGKTTSSSVVFLVA